MVEIRIHDVDAGFRRDGDSVVDTLASRNHRDQRLETLLPALELGGTRAVGSVGGKVATITSMAAMMTTT